MGSNAEVSAWGVLIQARHGSTRLPGRKQHDSDSDTSHYLKWFVMPDEEAHKPRLVLVGRAKEVARIIVVFDKSHFHLPEFRNSVREERGNKFDAESNYNE